MPRARNHVSSPTDRSALHAQNLTLNDQYFPSQVPPKAMLYCSQIARACRSHKQIPKRAKKVIIAFD
jgi:hypothetical protein